MLSCKLYSLVTPYTHIFSFTQVSKKKKKKADEQDEFYNMCWGQTIRRVYHQRPTISDPESKSISYVVPWALTSQVKNKPFNQDSVGCEQWPSCLHNIHSSSVFPWFRESNDETLGQAATRILDLLGKCVDQGKWVNHPKYDSPSAEFPNPILHPVKAVLTGPSKAQLDMCMQVSLPLLKKHIHTQAFVTSDGYYWLPVDKKKKGIYLHQLLVWLWHGWGCMQDLEVVHGCFFKACGNIHHLYLGTHSQNIRCQFSKSDEVRNDTMNALEAFKDKVVQEQQQHELLALMGTLTL